MIKVMVVYDEDPLYAGRLAEYVKPEGDISLSGNGIFRPGKTESLWQGP